MLRAAERKATMRDMQAWQARDNDTSRARGFFGEDNRGIVGAPDSPGIPDVLGIPDVPDLEKGIDFMMSN